MYFEPWQLHQPLSAAQVSGSIASLEGLGELLMPRFVAGQIDLVQIRAPSEGPSSGVSCIGFLDPHAPCFRLYFLAKNLLNGAKIAAISNPPFVVHFLHAQAAVATLGSVQPQHVSGQYTDNC